MIQTIAYIIDGKEYVFASSGDINRIKLEATSLHKINELDDKDTIIDIIDEFLDIRIYPTFEQILEVYNHLKEEDKKEEESNIVTDEWIVENTKDAPETRSIMLLYKDVLDMFGMEMDKTTFIKDINKSVDIYNTFRDLFSFGDCDCDDCDESDDLKTSCSDKFTEYHNLNRNIVRDNEPKQTDKTDNTKLYNLSNDLKDFLKENGYTNNISENYYNSPVDPYEGYYNKSNHDYNECYKEAFKKVRESEDRIGNEVDSLIKDFKLYLKKGDFKYILVNDFSQSFLKQASKLTEDGQMLLEICGIFEVFLNGFTNSNKMMKRLLHLIDVENADRFKIKSLLETELRNHICRYGAEVIDKKFNYLIKTKVYYENYKYYVEVKSTNR